MSEHQPNPADAAGDDDLAQMTPNQRRALNKALAALETMAALWASEIRLTDLSKRIADVPDAAERAKRIAAFVEQGFIEGAYRHYLDHKDQIEALATDNSQATGLVDQHHRDSAELRKLCVARDQARRTAEYWKAEHNASNKRIAELEAQIATVAPAVAAQPVGVAGAMPGTDGFTMAVFKADDIPIGTALYTSAQSEGLRKDAERLDWLDKNMFHREMNEWDARIHRGETMWVMFAPNGVQGSARNVIDAALSQHTGEKS
jgi:hypothetical protein